MLDREEWRVVEEAPAYKISSRGRLVRRHRNWRGEIEDRELRPALNRGYLRFVLCMDGKKVNRPAHVLVCTAFHGAKSDASMVCAHRDGDKLNNAPDNLYWATPKENADDRERHGRTFRGPMKPDVVARLPRGERHWSRLRPELVRRGASHWRTGTQGTGAVGEQMAQAKLTEAQVLEILATPKFHGSGRMLSDKFGVSMGLISAIRKRRAWTHLTPHPDTAQPPLRVGA